MKHQVKNCYYHGVGQKVYSGGFLDIFWVVIFLSLLYTLFLCTSFPGPFKKKLKVVNKKYNKKKCLSRYYLLGF